MSSMNPRPFNALNAALNPLPRWLAPTALALALAACAGTPPRSVALEDVRTRLTQAQADPAMRLHAADELRTADASVQAAEQALQARGASEHVQHLTHMATQRLAMAQATADRRAHHLVTANAAAERDRMRLHMRTQEADAAHHALVAANAQGDRQDQALAASDERAQDLRRQLDALNAKPSPRGMVVTLGDLHFDSGDSRLQASGVRSVVKLADFLKAHRGQSASIEGHTDSRGSNESNQQLSSRRADAVMAALVGLGVDAKRLQATGFGEEQPLANNAQAEGRQQNRRVEVVLRAAPAGPLGSGVAPQ